MKRRHSLPAQQFWTVVIFAACFAAFLIRPVLPTGGEFLTFAVLAALELATPYVSTRSDNGGLGTDTVLVFVFAGSLLLPPILFVLLALIPVMAVWIGLFSAAALRESEDVGSSITIGARLAAGLAVGILISYLHPSELMGWFSGLVVSGTLFLLPSWLVPLASRIRNDNHPNERLSPWRKAGLLHDCILLMLGAALVMIWQLNAWLVIPAWLQLLLLYHVSQIPRLEKQAQTDAKTGLWNVRQLDILFRNEIERASRFGRPLAILMADLDLMRNINNRHGHLAGDRVLGGIGEIIRSSLREYDIAARFGGEEFVIVLPETRQQEAALIADRIRKTVADEEFGTAFGNEPVHATMSFGIANFPSDGAGPPELLRAADRALYSAKARGRNRVVLASEAAESAINREPTPADADFEGRSPITALFNRMQLRRGLLTSGSAGERGFGPGLAWATMLILCGLVSGSTLIVAAQQALPGDPLYTIKIAGEDARLAFTSNEGIRTELELDMAHNRFQDLATLLESRRYEQVPAAVQAFTRELERASHSLALLQVHNPALAEALAKRTELDWAQVDAFLVSMRGQAPVEIQSAMALAVAAVQSQKALLETHLAELSASSSSSLSLALPTPEPLQTPEISPAPPAVVEPPTFDEGNAVPVRHAIAAITPSPADSSPQAVGSSRSGRLDKLVAFNVSKSSQARNRPTIGVLSANSRVTPASTPPNPQVAKPAKSKTPQPRCEDKTGCKGPGEPRTPPQPDIASVADWRERLATTK